VLHCAGVTAPVIVACTSLRNSSSEINAMDDVKGAEPVVQAVMTSTTLQQAAATFAGVVQLQSGTGQVTMGDRAASEIAPHLAHHISMLVAMFEGSVTDLSKLKRRLSDSTPGVQESVRAAGEATVKSFATVVAALRQIEDVMPSSASGDSVISGATSALTTPRSMAKGLSASRTGLDKLTVDTAVDPARTATRAIRRARAAVNEVASGFQAFEASCWVALPMLLDMIPVIAKAKVSHTRLGDGKWLWIVCVRRVSPTGVRCVFRHLWSSQRQRSRLSHPALA